MKRLLLSAAATAALSLGATAASAQGTTAPCPAGQECPDAGQGTTSPDGAMSAPEAPSTDQMAPTETSPMQSPETGAQPNATQPMQPDGATSGETGAGETTQPEAGTTDQQAPQGAESTQSPDTGTADQPGTAGSTTETNVEITQEQRVEIRNVIQDVDVDRINVDFDIDVGVTVPSTVVLHPLPARIVEIVPEYENFVFFILVDGRIVIVNPDTLVIVVIIDV